MNKKYIGKTPEEILSMMTLREKVAQTIVTGIGNIEEGKMVAERGFGGISAIWGHDKESMKRFRKDVDELQEISDIPLLIGTDMETGIGQIVHDPELATEFPEQMALGAIADLKEAKRLAYEEGRTISAEAVNMGWNFTYTPVVDVNNNASNPITNIRSIGEDAEKVSILTGELIKGIQDSGHMVATAKHFPGAGMQNNDSHFSLEETKADKDEMNKVHLYSFRKAIENGVKCIMCNHAIYPMYDEVNVATTSKAIMTDLLRNEMKFEGITITDAMGMAGVTAQDGDNKNMGTIRAIAAGNDLILGPYDAWNVQDALVDAVEKGLLSEERVNEAVLRILKIKESIGLFNQNKEMPERLDGWAVAKEIAKKSVTLIKDSKNLIPVNFSSLKKVMVLEPTHPAKRLDFGLYTNMTLIHETLKKVAHQAELALFSQDATKEEEQALVAQAKESDIVIVGTSFRSRSGQVGLLTQRQLEILKAIHTVNPNIIAVISNPYVSAQLDFIDTIVCCYSTSRVAVDAAVNVLYGKEKALGVLPVTIPKKLNTEHIQILSHEDVYKRQE